MAEERDYGDNVWGELEELGPGLRGKRLLRTPESHLVCAVWELDPGADPSPYHLHHGTDEYLVVLRGTPTLRTPDGERALVEGETVPFPRGLPGAHQVRNDTDQPIRLLMFAYHHTPDVIEYLDEGIVTVLARTDGGDGERLFKRYPPS
jgi:uncharacterized cupin superfamily protein